MQTNYIELTIDHYSFASAKTVFVAISDSYEFIIEYVNIAKKKACSYLNLDENEVIIHSWKFLGDDVIIIQ